MKFANKTKLDAKSIKTTKKEYINDGFEYGLKDLAFDLKSLTRKVIDENMLLRERELEKIKPCKHYNWFDKLKIILHR